MSIKVPQLKVPDFWLSNQALVQSYLDSQIKRGKVHWIGESVQGRPLRVIEYPAPGQPKLMLIGGTHGHEPGTVAACMNMLHLLETGSDLAGQPHEELAAMAGKIHLFVLPLLNPDGRAVCLDSFYGLGVDTCELYACGLQRNGDLIPYDAASDQPCYYFDPQEALFLGGQFNAAGWAINRRLSDELSEAIEVQQLLEYVKPLGLQAILDLHACGYNFAFQARSHAAPYWPVLREWQRRAEKLFAQKGRPLGPLVGDGDPPQPPPFFFNASLFHRQAQLGWMAFEGRQGYLGRASFMPQPTEWEIIDDYLSAIQIFLELGAEGLWAEAQSQTFGA